MFSGLISLLLCIIVWGLWKLFQRFILISPLDNIPDAPTLSKSYNYVPEQRKSSLSSCTPMTTFLCARKGGGVAKMAPFMGVQLSLSLHAKQVSSSMLQNKAPFGF